MDTVFSKHRFVTFLFQSISKSFKPGSNSRRAPKGAGGPLSAAAGLLGVQGKKLSTPEVLPSV